MANNPTSYCRVSIVVCILAKDEAGVIGNSLAQLSRQSFVKNGTEVIDIHVVANGCTDNTVDIGRSCQELFDNNRVRYFVHDLRVSGKSRTWNWAVHEFVRTSVEFIVFIDADITFLHDAVVAEMLACLRSKPARAVCSGFPVKDVGLKSKKTLLDRFSVLVSVQSQKAGVINGSLYIARAPYLQDIWLPDQTPGEDGFLNAMVTTRGFTQPPDPTLICTAATPTHSFKAHRPLEFVTHERRMIVGTMINRWIFEHLWSLGLPSPAGSLIRDWNEFDPEWVEKLVRQRAAEKLWLIPKGILLGRFKRKSVWWKQMAYIPVAAAATLLTVPPAILANKRLKELGAATTW